jgi:predicted nucleic acid-binding protein
VIVVIDTNVWMSALPFAKRRGTPTLALEKAMSEDVIAACDEVDAEIVRVLTKKFSWEQHRATSAAGDSGAWHPRDDSRHGQGMP